QMPLTAADRATLMGELRVLAGSHRLTESIDDFLVYSPFPVDIRHNAKIFREQLAAWAAAELEIKH
ncbi:MAG TPA: peptide synthase, partial [Pirellulales bacterium]|nr:peptide synthase [Pirellulales bacterium]